MEKDSPESSCGREARAATFRLNICNPKSLRGFGRGLEGRQGKVKAHEGREVFEVASVRLRRRSFAFLPVIVIIPAFARC